MKPSAQRSRFALAFNFPHLPLCTSATQANHTLGFETKVYVKPTNTGLLLHYHNHVDSRYKHGLLVTMFDRAHRLSSSLAHFSEECERLRGVFSKLRYPNHLIDSVINRFITSRVAVDQPKQHTDDAIRIAIPLV